MTGKVGSGNIGLLNVQTGDSDLGEGRNYTALRWRQDILERSSVGALVTNVEGPDGATNTVIGADVNFTFLDHLNISAFGARATTDNLADDLEDIDADHFRARATDDLDEEGKYAGQFRIGWQSDLWTASVDVMRIDPGFRSDLGFVLREDVVRRDYLASFNPRPDVSWLRSVTFDTFLTPLPELPIWLARLMGFPDAYPLADSLRDARRHLGNACSTASRRRSDLGATRIPR